MEDHYKYAIRKIEKRNGDKIYIPVAKPGSKIKLINFNEWFRIIKIYDTYELSTEYLDRDFGLSPNDCVEHINNFKRQLDERLGETTEKVELILMDDFQKQLQIA